MLRQARSAARKPGQARRYVGALPYLAMFAVVPALQLVRPGDYADDLVVTLYEGDLTAHSARDTARRVKRYERDHKDRASVIQAADKRLARS